MDNEIKINNYSSIHRIASDLHRSTPKNRVEDAFEATKELMDSMKLKSQVRQDKIELARERVRNGFYNSKEVLSHIANKILRELDME